MSPELPQVIANTAVGLFADGLAGDVLVRGLGLALERRGYGVRHRALIPSKHNGMLVAHATADLLVSGDTAIVFSENATPAELRVERLRQWLTATDLAAVVSLEPASDPLVLTQTKG